MTNNQTEILLLVLLKNKATMMIMFLILIPMQLIPYSIIRLIMVVLI